MAFTHVGTKYIKRQQDFDNFLKFRHTLVPTDNITLTLIYLYPPLFKISTKKILNALSMPLNCHPIKKNWDLNLELMKCPILLALAPDRAVHDTVNWYQLIPPSNCQRDFVFILNWNNSYAIGGTKLKDKEYAPTSENFKSSKISCVKLCCHGWLVSFASFCFHVVLHRNVKSSCRNWQRNILELRETNPVPEIY